MEIYLNVIEWGRGIYGAEAASQAYFEKPAADLTPDEAAALASILPSPRRWSPFSEKAFMARRRTQLLERMQRAGYVLYRSDNGCLMISLFLSPRCWNPRTPRRLLHRIRTAFKDGSDP